MCNLASQKEYSSTGLNRLRHSVVKRNEKNVPTISELGYICRIAKIGECFNSFLYPSHVTRKILKLGKSPTTLFIRHSGRMFFTARQNGFQYFSRHASDTPIKSLLCQLQCQKILVASLI